MPSKASDSPYANIVAIRTGDDSRAEIQKLKAALTSAEVKKFIENRIQGVPWFRPSDPGIEPLNNQGPPQHRLQAGLFLSGRAYSSAGGFIEQQDFRFLFAR